jgi:hypothetical protein
MKDAVDGAAAKVPTPITVNLTPGQVVLWTAGSMALKPRRPLASIPSILNETALTFGLPDYMPVNGMPTQPQDGAFLRVITTLSASATPSNPSGYTPAPGLVPDPGSIQLVHNLLLPWAHWQMKAANWTDSTHTLTPAGHKTSFVPNLVGNRTASAASTGFQSYPRMVFGWGRGRGGKFTNDSILFINPYTYLSTVSQPFVSGSMTALISVFAGESYSGDVPIMMIKDISGRSWTVRLSSSKVSLVDSVWSGARIDIPISPAAAQGRDPIMVGLSVGSEIYYYADETNHPASVTRPIALLSLWDGKNTYMNRMLLAGGISGVKDLIVGTNSVIDDDNGQFYVNDVIAYDKFMTGAELKMRLQQIGALNGMNANGQ